MGYASLQACVRDLRRNQRLVVVDADIDADQEAAAIVRRVYCAGGPALLFTRVKGSRFPLLGNLFGTIERARYIFRDAFEGVRQLVAVKSDPTALLKNPVKSAKMLPALFHSLPLPIAAKSAPVLAHRIPLSALPVVKTWPLDGGAFITLPQVYTEDPGRPGWMRSNLGMYRIQLDGGDYVPDAEVGMHYQIHRGIGVHHARALERGERLRVHIFVGGPPALTLSAVMPLPEGIPEIAFGGALGGRNVRLARYHDGLPIFADADFCIVGSIANGRTRPEGPFGDHLGYYSLTHEFPVLEVEAVYHRPGAIWPFTSVGRPPQEDTTFGELVHEISGPAIPAVLPGIKAVHAVDAAGVHPLLLAVGSERYTPYQDRRVPQELLTQAHALLGQGQLSLAKYLFIVAHEDDPQLDIHDIRAFFRHLLTRIDLRRDLHFQTCTTIDTLDYSGGVLNQGSKLVVAAVGPPRRQLGDDVPSIELPAGFRNPRLCMNGVLAVSGPPAERDRVDADGRDPALKTLCTMLPELPEHPLVVVVDDSDFVAAELDNFIWVTFTRSNPAADVHGAASSIKTKHWGCRGPLVIDARRKPHHAPPLEESPAVIARLERLSARGGPLHGLW